MYNNAKHHRPHTMRRLNKRLAIGLATVGITAALVIFTFAGFGSPSTSARPRPHSLGHTRRKELAIHTVSQGAADCPAPVVDWSQFQGFQPGSTAGLLAEDVQDPALPWVIRGLQSRSYAVRLFIEEANLPQAYAVLKQHELHESVPIEVVEVHHYMLNASFVHMFVFMPLDEYTVVAGRGTINWILLPDGSMSSHVRANGNAGGSGLDDAEIADAGDSETIAGGRWASGGSGSMRTHGASTYDRFSRGIKKGLSSVRRGWRPDATPSTAAARPQDLALSTYDFMLYRSIPDLSRHLKVMTPALERLQNENKLFPLVDVLTFPTTITEESQKAYQAKFDQMAHRSGLNKVFRFFLQSTLSLYKARLTPTTQRIRDERAHRAHSVNGDATYAAVIVEARPHFAFLYTVLNAVWYLPGWTMNVVHSRMNADFVRNMLSPHLNVRYHQLETENMSIDDYNNLMKNKTFWQMLNADYILLFQTDSLILKPGAENFLQFDYIGAPWHMENERWSQPALRKALPDGVGNGGFSLRSARAMITVCERYSKTSPLKEQEDVFYGVHIMEDPQFRLGDRLSAYRFCLEVPCRDLPMDIPFGLHASWYYNDLPTMIKMLDYSLYGLADCN